jgi:hypothetical protein
LTPDQKAFIQDAIDSGRFAREEDAVRGANGLTLLMFKTASVHCLALWDDDGGPVHGIALHGG